MAAAEHYENIELQEMDDPIYDDINARPSAQERDPHHVDSTTAAGVEVEIDEEVHYDQLDVQQMHDMTYEDFRNTTRKEKELLKTLRTDIRRYKRGRVRDRLLCAVLALLNVALPLYLYQSNMLERQKLLISFDELQNRHNLTEQLLNTLEKLETKYDKLETRYDKLETRYDLLTEEREQLQTRINNLTKERDDLKIRLCEPHGFTFGDGLCYYVSTEKKNWTESRQWCTDRHSDLIVIKSKEKQDFVERVNKRVWLGLTDRDREGSFQWVDGTPLTSPTYWYPNAPHNQTSNNDCVEFYDGSQVDAPKRGWNDIACSDHSTYWICERVLS